MPFSDDRRTLRPDQDRNGVPCGLTTDAYAQTEVRQISRTDVLKFASAVRTDNPACLSLEAAHARGYPDLLAPPMFFTSLGLSMGRIRPRSQLDHAGLPLDDPLSGRRVIAGETHVEWSGDLFAGDVVTIRQTLMSEQQRTGNSGEFTVCTIERTYERAGEVVVRQL